MLKITRTLQKQIDEKTTEIDKINLATKKLEKEFELEQATREETFKQTKEAIQKNQE